MNSGVEAELARLPRQVEGVDRDAVAAETGTRAEAHEAERLRRRRVDDLPNVDRHPVAELRELVDECDVDRAEDVLEQLRQFRCLRRRHLDDRVDRAAVDVRCVLRALRRDPAEHLRRRLRRPVLAARVDALRRHRKMEAGADLQPGTLLEDREQHFPRRPRPCCRLEHDDLPCVQHLRNPARRRLDDGEVRLALAGERGRERDEDRLGVLQLLVVGRRPYEVPVDERLEALALDVLDVALASIQRVDDRLDDVDEEHAAPRFGEGGRKRQPDVARSDDPDVVRHGAQA